MRDAAWCLLVFASLTGTAAADMVPEDPYKDVEPTKVESLNVEVDATSGVGPVIKSEVARASASSGSAATGSAASASIASTSEGGEAVGEEWWEQQEVQIGGGVGFGLLFLGLVIRGRRNARRRRLALADRRTQFGMSAVDPTLAKLNVAAWERGPAIMPTAIEPEMMNAGRPRAGSAPFIASIEVEPLAARPIAHAAQPFVAAAVPYAAGAHQPYVPSQPIAQPLSPLVSAQPLPSLPPAPAYRHYSEADLAAYGMRPSQHDVRASSPAQIAQPARREGSQPAMVIPPHAGVNAAQLMQHVQSQSVPVQQPQPAQQPLPSLPPAPQAPRGSWHPTVLPWDQAAQQAPQPSHHAPALAPFVGQAAPQHHAPALQAFMAPAPNARRARLAEGTPQPPMNQQPFVALPPQALPKPVAPHAMPTVAPHLAQTQFAPSHDAEATTHFTQYGPAPTPHYASQFAPSAPMHPLPFPPQFTPPSVPLQPHLSQPAPQSFVLENSAVQMPQAPAEYPLTFPAFPEAAGAVMLAPIEPSGLNYWGPPTTEVEGEAIIFSQLESDVPFARGSQPVEHLEPIRVTLPQAAAHDAETRIAPAPIDKRTFPMHKRR